VKHTDTRAAAWEGVWPNASARSTLTDGLLHGRAHGRSALRRAAAARAGDGLLTAVRLAAFEVLDQRAILFNDCADRVASLLRLRLRAAAPPRCRPGSLVRPRAQPPVIPRPPARAAEAAASVLLFHCRAPQLRDPHGADRHARLASAGPLAPPARMAPRASACSTSAAPLHGGEGPARFVPQQGLLLRHVNEARPLRAPTRPPHPPPRSRIAQDCQVPGTNPDPPQEVVVVNTHLLYPHNACSTIIRLREVHKILEYLQARAPPWNRVWGARIWALFRVWALSTI